MLSKNQIEKLLPLTKHERYGKLLKDALEIWEREDTSPRSGIWGVCIDDYLESFKLSNNCCCLLGAALVDKKLYGTEHFECIAHHYEISWREAKDLMNGFDHPWRDSISEAEDFGKQIAKICFG